MGAAAAINAKQISAIYALSRKYGMDNETLHGMVEGRTGKASIRQLTGREAAGVIDRLRDLLGEEKPTPANRGTTAQYRKIEELVKNLGWNDNPQRLRAFLEKRFGCSDMKFLPANKVSACINALKAIQAGGRGERKSYADTSGK